MTKLSPDATSRQRWGPSRSLGRPRLLGLRHLPSTGTAHRPSVAAALRELDTSLACARTRTTPNRCSPPLTRNTLACGRMS